MAFTFEYLENALNEYDNNKGFFPWVLSSLPTWTGLSSPDPLPLTKLRGFLEKKKVDNQNLPDDILLELGEILSRYSYLQSSFITSDKTSETARLIIIRDTLHQGGFYNGKALRFMLDLSLTEADKAIFSLCTHLCKLSPSLMNESNFTYIVRYQAILGWSGMTEIQTQIKTQDQLDIIFENCFSNGKVLAIARALIKETLNQQGSANPYNHPALASPESRRFSDESADPFAYLDGQLLHTGEPENEEVEYHEMISYPTADWEPPTKTFS